MSLFTQLYRCCWTSFLTSHICIHIRTKGLLTQLFDIPPLCVENNKIFTQMPNTTPHHNTTPKTPPSHIRGGIFTQMLTTTTTTPPPNDVIHSRHSTHSIGCQNWSWTVAFPLLLSCSWWDNNYNHKYSDLSRNETYVQILFSRCLRLLIFFKMFVFMQVFNLGHFFTKKGIHSHVKEEIF